MEAFGLIVSLAFHCLWAWACYNVAQRKGRSAELGAVMGFLFGLIAYIIYSMLSDNSYSTYETGGYSPVTPKNVAPPPSRTCWSCNTAVTGSAGICQGCGVRLQF